jgi:gentisate 1,2-dioxygenase
MDDAPAGRGKPTLEEFHAAMAQADVGALWEVQAAEAAHPPRKDKPLLWRWRDLQPLIDMTAQVVNTEEAERRVLMLQNPATGHGNMSGPATPNLTANLQILLPGEKARPHRHTIHALRFVMEGSGATTLVDGKACPMEPGDMILTPAWTWHEHMHQGTERMVWFDGLDAPLRRHMKVAEFEPGPVHDLPATAADAAFDAIGLVPEGAPAPKDYSPIFRYSWTAARAALDHTPVARDGSRTLRYVNPQTGGPAMSLFECYLVGLPKGAATRPQRSSANAVYIVAQGSGTSTIGDETFKWEKNDIFTMPRNHWGSHTASSGDAVLFAMTDRDLMARLGLLTDDIKDA